MNDSNHNEKYRKIYYKREKSRELANNNNIEKSVWQHQQNQLIIVILRTQQVI